MALCKGSDKSYPNMENEVIFIAISLICLYLQSIQAQVLPPIRDGIEVGLTIVPGAYINSSQYEEIGRQIQTYSSRKLWIYLAEGPLRDQEQNGGHVLNTTLGAAKQQLIDAGMAQDADYFAAGHSLGGVIIESEILDFPDLVQAMIMWAATLTSPYDRIQCPVATLSGDMDGGTRITRVLSTNRIILNDSLSNPSLRYTHPTRVLPGVNHGQYATAPVPPLPQEDLPSYITDEEAKALIANATAVFIDYHSRVNGEPGASFEIIMDEWFEATLEVAEPIFRILDIESDPDRESSLWVEQAQTLISGLVGEELPYIEVHDSIVDPDMLQNERANVTETAEGVLVSSVTALYYDIFSSYQAADMLESKMSSSQYIKQILYETPQPPEKPVNCTDINKEAWSLAINLLPVFRLTLFNNTGVRVHFLDDNQVLSGPGWLQSELLFEFNRTSLMLHVQSTQLWTSPDSDPFPSGAHYCKLLSPAKAFEFMYIDALRPPLI